MAEETEKSDHEKELSSKLLKRLGFAGIMVLLLLGAWFYSRDGRLPKGMFAR